MKGAILISLLILAGCKKEILKPEACTTVFEVALDLDHWAKDSLGNYYSDLPRFNYYEEHNFIVDKGGRIFYYPREKKTLYCGTDVLDGKPKPIVNPDFINLQPYQIIELKKNQIKDFVKLNVNLKDQTNLVVIASEKDKFKSQAICNLFESLYDNNSQNLAFVRKMTEEEKMVMKYKMKNEYYNPAEINWTETTIVKADFK